MTAPATILVVDDDPDFMDQMRLEQLVREINRLLKECA